MKVNGHILKILSATVMLMVSLPAVSLANLYTKSFNTQSGLSDNTVRTIHQDKEGYIWFGTLNGLTRFDGYTMTSIPYRDSSGNQLYEPKVRQLHEDEMGNLWVLSTNDGVACIDLETFRFRNFLPEGSPQYFRYIYEAPDKSVWLFGGNGALHVSGSGEEMFKTSILTKGNGMLPSDNIIRISGDTAGNIFIATDKGIVKYAGGNADIIDFFHQVQWFAPHSDMMLAVAANGDVLSIDNNSQVSPRGSIPGVNSRDNLPGEFMANGKWFISGPSGIYSFDLDTGTLSKSKLGDIPNAKVIKDNAGNIWLHNETGKIWRVDTISESTRQYSIISPDRMKLIDMERYSVMNDNEGRTIITTSGSGLYTIDEVSGDITHYSTANPGSSLLQSDNLLAVAKDRSGAMWIGTEDIGVVKVSKSSYSIKEIDDKGKKNRAIRMIKQLSDGSIVISYYDGSFDTYDKDMKPLASRQYPKVVYDLMETADGNVWKATRGGNIFFENSKGDAISNDGFTPSHHTIFSMLRDSNGRLWVGTFGAGLDVVIPSGNGNKPESKNFLNDTYGKKRIRAIFEDSGKNIWVGTSEGAYRFNPDSLIAGLQTLKEFSVANRFLNTNEVNCITEDNKGRIWIGEGGGGITILNFSDPNDRIIHIGNENGLPNSNIQSFVSDGNGYIWAFTYMGAARVNVESLNVESYIFRTNTLGNVYRPNTALLLPGNRLLLGSSDGAYLVDINNLNAKGKPETPHATSLRINGISLSDGHAENPLWGNLSSHDKIVLSHDENSIDIAFSTFDYNTEMPDKFRYKLEPYDKTWSEFADDNHVSFRNLAPGKYILKVQALNTSGELSDVKEIEIHIKTPWWSSWWAKTFYVLLIILSAVLFMYSIDRIRTLRSKVRQEKEMTDFKLEFYTNISHEFRTPLTLIQASIEKTSESIANIKSEHPEVSVSPLRSSLSTLDKNAKRMLRLIEELLTFRKMERNKLRLSYERTEIVAFVKDLFNNFIDEAKSKEIQYSFHCNEREYFMNVDRNALDKIVTNLISNAIKYTFEKGTVEVDLNIDRHNRKMELRMRDNGIGISPDKKALLFSRFMQTGLSRSSIGVGLHLTHGLVKLHEGDITHSDNAGGGSVFTVTLPLDLHESLEKVDDTLGRPTFSSFVENMENAENADNHEEEPEELDADKNETDRRTLLVIDDDSEIRKLLQDEFSPYFNVLTASNGRTGLDMARQNDVNLVICDVMLPDISGFKITRMLKDDFATSHIPVIQLTALNNDESQFEGMECGADAYVTKPFKLKYLKMLVGKIMERYEGMIAKFSASPSIPKPQIPLGNKDTEFADKLTEVVLRNMDNTEFTVDEFSSQMAMGRTVFFKKVKGVTGYSPKEYIRVMRMKHAAELLLTTDHTITEISFMVGITDPSYFNKCFRSQFGKAPSVYKKENTSQQSADNTQS